MKRTLLFVTTLITTVMIMAFTVGGGYDCKPLNDTGALPGHAGDPAGGNLNCTSCHSDVPIATMQTGWITSNIPGTGYVPNTTYTITATGAGAGHTKFGFEVSPQNSSGTFLGTLVNTSSQTQLTTDPNYITHTLSGTSGTGFKTWIFNWTAPAASSGSVTFYGAFNITNADNGTSGDTIMLSTLTVNENITGIEENDLLTKISLYPNPFSNQTTLRTDYHLKNVTLTVTNYIGQTVAQINNINGKTITFNRDNLPSGQYLVCLTQDNKIIAIEKLVIVDK